jgi:hypothetical protein
MAISRGGTGVSPAGRAAPGTSYSTVPSGPASSSGYRRTSVGSDSSGESPFPCGARVTAATYAGR